MKKPVFSVVCALAASALLSSLGTSAKAAPAKQPNNLELLNKALSQVKPGQKFIFFGDMGVPVERVRAYRDKVAGVRTTKSAFDTHTNYWPKGIVPYAFDADLPQVAQDAFVAAGKEWSKYANLTFIPHTTETNYIQVHTATVRNGVSYSLLGMTGGAQGMTLQPDVSEWVTAHEMGHALGLDHEHQRSDRDKYIEVHLENVADSDESQFTIISDTDNIGPYDFDSIMHYFDTSFSTNGQKTMVCRPGYEQYQSKMGQQDHLSELDKVGMAKIYGFPPGVNPTPAPTPANPTISADDVSVSEGNPGEPHTMTFRVKLTQLPKNDVTFSYKIAPYQPQGVSGDDVNKYSAIPGVDYNADQMEGTITLPAATTDNNGNSTKEADITLSIVADTTVENDESLLLVLSNPINARFMNDASTITVKGTILNDDFDATATPAPTGTPKPTATAKPTGTPKPTTQPTPVPTPSVRVSLSPTTPLKTDIVKATVTLTPSTGTTAQLEWKLNGYTIARNVSQVNLSTVRGVKKGDSITVTVTPLRGTVKGSLVTATVTVGNTPPIANDVTVTTLSAVPVTATLSGSDADGDALTYSMVIRPNHGTATLTQSNGKWIVTYRSQVAFIGTDVVGVVANDGKAKSQNAMVQIKVNANTSPTLAVLTPTDKSYAVGTTASFKQTISDAEKNVSSVRLMLSNSSSSSVGRNGVYVQYNVADKTISLANSGATAFSEPVAIGATLENDQAKIVLRSVSQTGTTLTLNWQITAKAGWTGTKTFWARAEDTGTLVDGFTQVGQVTFTDSSSTATSANKS